MPATASIATAAKVAITNGRATYYLANKTGIITSAERLTPAQSKAFTGKTIEYQAATTPVPTPKAVAASAPKTTAAASTLPRTKPTASATNSSSAATSASLPAKTKTVNFQKEAGKQGGMVVKRGGNNRITGVKYTQTHHILHQKLRKHPLWKKAGKDIEIPGNKMLLPTTKGTQYTTTTRSVHQGRHTKDIERNLERQMDKALIRGKREGWSQTQYAKALRRIISRERAQLKSGARRLNAAKDHRITGE